MVIVAMGYFSLVAVLLLVLFAGGTNAARLHPTRQEDSSNDTSLLSQTGLLQGVANTSSIITYWATHEMQAEESGGYYGFSVTMDVYDFSLASDQYSLALVHIFNPGDGAVTSLSSIQIGWEVNPQTYGGDSRAHLSAFWTNDGFQNTRCLNTDCPLGFQPEAGASMVLGGVIEPVSQPNGAKQNITIKVLKGGESGDWLVHYGFNQVEPTLIGRYPKSLFTGGLADRASNIHIGGVVMTTRSADMVPMGSGYLPSTSVAASFNNFQIIDKIGQASLVNQNLRGHVSQPDKYSVSPVINGQFFYGGPSQSMM